MEECCYWWIDNKRVLSMWLYWIWWQNFKFAFKNKETIKKREVPEEVIQGVNKFLKEMLALQLDEESPDEEVELSENFTANVNRNDHGEPQNVEDFFTELELSTKNK